MKRSNKIPLENYVVDFESMRFPVYEIKYFSLTTNFCKVKRKNQYKSYDACLFSLSLIFPVPFLFRWVIHSSNILNVKSLSPFNQPLPPNNLVILS